MIPQSSIILNAYPQLVHKIATKVRGFSAKMSSIQA